MKRLKANLMTLLPPHIIFIGALLAFSIGQANANTEPSPNNTNVNAPQATTSKKAVIESSKENGIRLTDKAVQMIEVSTREVEQSSTLSIPHIALVHSLDQVGVYRLRDGWFKMIPIAILSQSVAQVVIRSSELKSSDHIVIHGVALLRVAEMEAFGGGGE